MGQDIFSYVIKLYFERTLSLSTNTNAKFIYKFIEKASDLQLY